MFNSLFFRLLLIVLLFQAFFGTALFYVVGPPNAGQFCLLLVLNLVLAVGLVVCVRASVKGESSLSAVPNKDTSDYKLPERLRLNEAKLNMIIRQMPVGILVAREDGTVEQTNDALSQFLGIPLSKIIGNNAATLLGIEWGQVAKSNIPMELSRTFNLTRTTHAEHSTLELTVGVALTQDGMRYIVNVHDRTETRRMEKLRKQFIAMLAHDLRAPLSNAMLVLSMVTAEGPDSLAPKLSAELTGVKSDLSRLVELISQLLVIEKMQAGHGTALNLSAVPVHDLMNQSFDSVRYLAREKSIEILNELKRSHTLLCDREQVVRVLVNMLSNAVKFAPRETFIRVSSSEHDSRIRISVADQGPGIAAELQDSLFKPYVQGESAARAEGSGLGLAICKQIIEAHGGAMGLTSEVEGGATFWFELQAFEPPEGTWESLLEATQEPG